MLKFIVCLLFSTTLYAEYVPLPIEKQIREEIFESLWGLNAADSEKVSQKLRLAEERVDYEEMLTKFYQAAKTFKAKPFDYSLWAQYPDAVEIEPTHKILAETAKVRILEVVMEPDYLQAFHTHKFGGIILDLVCSDFILYHDGTEEILSAADDPVFVHIEGQPLHTTKNIGKATYVGLHCEVKTPFCG